jgi:hypothetical protein
MYGKHQQVPRRTGTVSESQAERGISENLNGGWPETETLQSAGQAGRKVDAMGRDKREDS